MADAVDAQRVSRLARLVAQLLTHRRFAKNVFATCKTKKDTVAFPKKSEQPAGLRIRDVYPGSDFFPSRIPDPYFSIPDPHQRI
jgi:hypothetical protein